jgi:hypothetical protein
MKFTHGRTQIVRRGAGGLHHQVSHPRDRQRAFARARRRVDDQQVVLFRDPKGLLGRREGLDASPRRSGSAGINYSWSGSTALTITIRTCGERTCRREAASTKQGTIDGIAGLINL